MKKIKKDKKKITKESWKDKIKKAITSLVT